MVEFYVTSTTTTIPLGRQGENLARNIYFELTDMIEEYGDGTATLVCLRSKDDAPYVCDTTRDGVMLEWSPTDTDTSYAGTGRCELRWVVDDVLAKSIVYRTSVTESITGDSTIPSQYESWYDALIDQISQYAIASQQIGINTAGIAVNTSDIAVLDGRVDALSTLSEGSTTGDAELIDGRVGYDGTVYANIGAAIRGQVTALHDDIDELPFIDVAAVSAMTDSTKLYRCDGTIYYYDGTAWVEVGTGSGGGITVVSTAAEMTDTAAVYMYNGTETGYTAGHWYYYDTGTSAWTDGGSYTGWGTIESVLAENTIEMCPLTIVIGSNTYTYNGTGNVSITLPVYNGGVS